MQKSAVENKRYTGEVPRETRAGGEKSRDTVSWDREVSRGSSRSLESQTSKVMPYSAPFPQRSGPVISQDSISNLVGAGAGAGPYEE